MMDPNSLLILPDDVILKLIPDPWMLDLKSLAVAKHKYCLKAQIGEHRKPHLVSFEHNVRVTRSMCRTLGSDI